MPLATADGNLVKTQKSKLMQVVEAEVVHPTIEVIPPNGAMIVDAMALLQTIKIIPNTFGDLSKLILQQLMSIADYYYVRRIDFVCDRYPAQSIKDLERNKRGKDGSTLTKIYDSEQKVPKQWKKFLSTGENKEEIMRFLFEHWKTVDVKNFGHKESYLTHESDCHRFSSGEDVLLVSQVFELTSNHEEADTRMLLHAYHVAQTGFENVIIRSPDTDVFVIALYASLSMINHIIFLTGTGNNRRMFSMTSFKEQLGEDICNALPGFHAFTGMPIAF